MVSHLYNIAENRNKKEKTGMPYISISTDVLQKKMLEGKNIKRNFVDASVTQWGQIKTRKLYLSVIPLPPSSV